MNIIEQIKTFPDGELHITGRPTEPFFETAVKGSSLKALAESHERLMDAAKRFTEKGVWYNSSRDADVVDDAEFDLLKATIAEAEKL